jgi:hypothetical protein
MHATLSMPIKATPRMLDRGELAKQLCTSPITGYGQCLARREKPYLGGGDLSEISSMRRAAGQRTRTHYHLLVYVSATKTQQCSPNVHEHGVMSINVGNSKTDNLLAKIVVSCG